MTTPIPQLLELWRETHAPEVGQLLISFSKESSRALEPIDTSAGEVKAMSAWLTLAALKRTRFEELPVLLDAALDGASTRVCKRLKILRTFDDDPRIGVMAAEALVALDGNAGEVAENNIAAALFDLIVVHGDSSIFDITRQYDLPNSKKQMLRVHKAFDSRERRGLTAAECTFLSSFDVDAVSGAEGKLARARSSQEQSVAVDAVLEEGGPRAEMVLLQAHAKRRPLTPKERSRIKALRKKYARVWLGRLAKVMHDDPSFENGLVSGGSTWASPDELERVLDANEWQTVRRLEFTSGPSLELLRRWPNITEVEVSHGDSVLELASASPPLGITRLTTPWLLKTPALREMAGLPALAHLVVGSSDFELARWVLNGSLCKRVKTFTRKFTVDEIENVELAGLLTLLKGTTLEQVIAAREYGGWRIEISRKREACVHFTEPEHRAAAVFNELVEMLFRFVDDPPDISTWVAGHLEAGGTKEDRRQFDSALEKLNARRR